MKRVLFTRILIYYLVIVTLLFTALELYLPRFIKHTYISNLKEDLIIQGHLIADQIPPSFIYNLDNFCKKYKEKTGTRITIIDGSGRVVGDSDEPSEKMENHLYRPEVKEASLNNIGSSIHFSNTLQKDFLYLAIKLNGDMSKGFLRLSVPLTEVESEVSLIKKGILFSWLAALLIVTLFGLLQIRRITKSIEEITAFSQEVAAGNFKRRLFLKEKDELGELGKNISNMAQELKTKLTQSEEEKYKMEAILRNMSDGLMLTDTRGRILLCNSAVKNFFGIESDIEGQALIENLRNEELVKTINKVVESGETISHEIEVAHPKELYLMTTAAPFYSVREKMSGVVLTFHDITRLKQLEEVRKDFVANVSHEIKTPITAIKGFAETLLEGAIDDRENAYKFLETIKNHSERLNSLVSDLLTLSRIELGDIKIEKTAVNLEDVVESVFATLIDKARNKGLYLEKQILHDFPKVMADRNSLIQILLNLVDNGIKFTEEGGVTVKVQSSRIKVQNEKEIVDSSIITHHPSRGHFLEITVEDTGIGIPRKNLSRLGERFYRVDKARSRDLGGTGLGLAIVKHLVKAHGWDMEIESTLGKGTTVKILVS
jgi:two-component system phosphate regulon sensor histidine kinase PhoR